MNNTGCKNCGDRHPGCHSSCQKYAEYRAEIDRNAAEQEKNVQINVFKKDFKTRYLHMMSIKKQGGRQRVLMGNYIEYDSKLGFTYHRSKFHNVEASEGDLKFDSKKEKARYKVLKAMADDGSIKNLEMQKPYILIPNQTDENGKVIERACKYFADFVYVTKDGTEVVEDVKSNITRKLPEYVIKRKLMLWVHNIRIKEV